MIVIDKTSARRMEQCIQHVHAAVTSQYPQGKIVPINGGIACFSGFDSYLSQVIGWGFDTKINQIKKEVQQIEAFYRQLGHSQIDIELCPFVGDELFIYLNHRGYHITELNSVSLLELKNVTCNNLSSSFSIKKIALHELSSWSLKVAQAFDCPQAQEHFFNYAKIPGVVAFAAYDKSLIVAGAVIAIVDDCCDLGLASTLPAYRAQGLQKALLAARLAYARELGLSWAVVTTSPGSISDSNVQKMGFQSAYTRIKLSRKDFK